MLETITADDIAKPNISVRTFKDSYRNNKTVWLMPTRGMIPLRVHVSLRNLGWLPNTPRGHIEIENMEVAAAYEEGFGRALSSPDCADMPWIWTYEEDNVQPRDVFTKLFEAIWTCIDCGVGMPAKPGGAPADEWICQNGHKGLDAVAGLYKTKTDPSMWMAFGDPANEGLDFRPINMDDRSGVIEVNGIAMGCTLWRAGLFKKVSRPWFKTLTGAETEPIGSYTQDLYLCRKAKEEVNARFAVHTGVSVGHLDWKTGVLY